MTDQTVTLPDDAWMLGLEKTIDAVESSNNPALLRRATEILFSRFPQRQPTQLSKPLFPRAASVAERLLHLVLRREVEGDVDFTILTALECICQTAQSPEQVLRALSDGTVEPVAPRALYWMAANADALALASPEALGWVASRLPAEDSQQHQWYLVRHALRAIPRDATGVRAIANVLAADSRANPERHWSHTDKGEIDPVAHPHEWELSFGGISATILNDSEETCRLHQELHASHDYELRAVIHEAVAAFAADPTLLAALEGTSWPVAFWRRLAEEAVTNAALRERVWELCLSAPLAEHAATPIAALALRVLQEGGSRAATVEQSLEKDPESFRGILFCVDEERIASAKLKESIAKARGEFSRCVPDDLEPQYSSNVSIGAPEPHWWLRSRGVDVAANAEPIALIDAAEAFWTKHLNEPPRDEIAADIVPTLRALLGAAENVSHPQALRDSLASALLRACRAFLLRREVSAEHRKLCRDALRMGRGVFLEPHDEFIELAAMLLEQVDSLDSEHREWLAWGRSRKDKDGDEKVNLYFRIYLIALHQFDSDWAWRELGLWLDRKKPDDFLIRAMWQFLRLRQDEVVARAIEAERRWAAADKTTRLSLGGLLAFAAIVRKHEAATAWLDRLASTSEVPALSVHGALWWMREHGWLSKDAATRNASRVWVPRLAANIRAHLAAEAGHELVFNLSACLVRQPPDQEPIDDAAKAELIKAWSGALRDVARGVALNAYEIWQLLGVIDAWTEVEATEASEALRALAERHEGGVAGAEIMMHARDVVPTVQAIAARIHGNIEATKNLLSVIERLIVTRNPKATPLMTLRLDLARSLGPA